MSTIPASALVNVIPNVLTAGGNALVLNGMFLTQTARVPIGTVASFANSAAVSTYFGASSHEAALATVYFLGYNNSTQLPGAIDFIQYPSTAVSAFLRSGPVNTYTIPQLQAISGTLTVVVDGFARTAGALSLSGASSYSAAASLIQTALNTTPVSEASVTGAIAPGTASVTGSIGGYILNVTTVSSGTVQLGSVISGTGVTAGTTVVNQLTGITGGVGTYAVSVSQTVPSGTTISVSYGTLTVSAVSSGTLSVGQTITGTGVTAGTTIAALGTGTGTTGTYFVNLTQTVASEALTANSTGVVVSYDSVSGGFVVSSGITGTASTIAFATGTVSAALMMTAATSAIVSQGAAATTPGVFMTNLTTNITTNWATFTTCFDPDGGSGNAQKLAFATWVNGTVDEFCYVCWDTDGTAPVTVPATTSLGYLLQQNNYSGTYLTWASTDLLHEAFICGIGASINFAGLNARITFAFKSQSGLTASVTNITTATNLQANGYNFYGAYATANQNFIGVYPGSISGPFLWMDGYMNQIWLNSQFQLALMSLLFNVGSIPYNTQGYALIQAALTGPINAAISFGAIRAGIVLSPAQIAELNYAAGISINQTVQSNGWYLQVLNPTPQIREARGTPQCNFWYTDGGAVQKITLNSIDIF